MTSFGPRPVKKTQSKGKEPAKMPHNDADAQGPSWLTSELIAQIAAQVVLQINPQLDNISKQVVLLEQKVEALPSSIQTTMEARFIALEEQVVQLAAANKENTDTIALLTTELQKSREEIDALKAAAHRPQHNTSIMSKEWQEQQLRAPNMVVSNVSEAVASKPVPQLQEAIMQAIQQAVGPRFDGRILECKALPASRRAGARRKVLVRFDSAATCQLVKQRRKLFSLNKSQEEALYINDDLTPKQQEHWRKMQPVFWALRARDPPKKPFFEGELLMWWGDNGNAARASYHPANFDEAELAKFPPPPRGTEQLHGPANRNGAGARSRGDGNTGGGRNGPLM